MVDNKKEHMQSTESGWQPMGTLPDGEWVLVARREDSVVFREFFDLSVPNDLSTWAYWCPLPKAPAFTTHSQEREHWTDAPLPDAHVPLADMSAAERKATPIYSGFVKYFPKAMAEVAALSKAGNEQHNPDKPLHWDRSKSGDELDALQRHLMDAGTRDTDGQRHSAKVAWRALANLEKEIEAELAKNILSKSMTSEAAPIPVVPLKKCLQCHINFNENYPICPNCRVFR